MGHTTAVVHGLPKGTTKGQVEDHFNQQIHINSPCVAGTVVDEVQGDTCSTTVTFRDEKQGQRRTSQKLIREFNASGFRGTSRTISVTDGFLGLTPLAGNIDAPVHIYFLHGLGGHAFNTWSFDVPHDRIESLKAWPRDFLPGRLSEENINARIYTLGYNANMLRKAAPNATIDSYAEDLLSVLYGDRKEGHPQEIYFVCHSLGGLIVCQALNKVLFQDPGYPTLAHYRDLFVRDSECIVKGIVLMGTPLRGSNQATLFNPYIKAIKQLNIYSAMNDNLIKSLSAHQPMGISDIVLRFQTIIKEKEIKLVICCEETPVAGTELTTTDESAKAIFGQSAIVVRIHEDHRRMVKFDDKSHGDYKLLENHIVKMMRPPSQRYSPASARVSSNYVTSYAVQDDRLGKHSQHTLNNFSGAQGNRRQQTFPQGPFKEHRPSTSSSSNALSNGLANLNLQPRRHDTMQSETSTLVNKRNTTDDNDIFNRLRMFDTVFIVDDTGSMVLAAYEEEPEGPSRWDATKQALGHIIDLAAPKDEDGIDIRFLKSTNLDGGHMKSVEDVMRLVEEVDMFDDRRGGGTFFEEHLKDEISPRCEEYRRYFKHNADYISKDRAARARLEKPQRPKMLNLIVITDGQADDKQEVEDYIVETARELDRLGAPAAQIGIQFVQIGEDQDARKFLKRLDDDLKHQDPPIRDMVDTTRCDSDRVQGLEFQAVLEQVLLGAITRDIDQRNSART